MIYYHYMTDNTESENLTLEKPSSEPEFMSNEELIQGLSKIATHYGTLDAMCRKSIELKKQNQEDLYRILDAAIALQIYAQTLKNSDDPEKKELALHLIRKTFTKLSGV